MDRDNVCPLVGHMCPPKLLRTRLVLVPASAIMPEKVAIRGKVQNCAVNAQIPWIFSSVQCLIS